MNVAVRLEPDPTLSYHAFYAPEKSLWAAVLARALHDVAGLNTYLHPAVRRYVQRSAEAWIESPVRGPGSYLWICEVLGLDAESVRRQVLKSPSEVLAARIKAVGGQGRDGGKPQQTGES